MSTILGSTFTSTAADTTFNTSRSDPRAPAGFDLQCKGLSTEGNNPNTVGVIFQLTVPSGYTLDQSDDKRTGSWMTSGSGHYDMWRIGIDQDARGEGGTYTIEIWFNEDDQTSDAWSMPFEMSVKSGSNTSTYTYVFTKGGSGGGD